jgi:phosphoenolpyruvate synthase/pyruvate phosphate dikinase
MTDMAAIRNLAEVDYSKVGLVGGKAASLGEMIKVGVSVPSGFVITTKAYVQGMNPKLEKAILQTFDQLGSKCVAVRSSAVAEDSGGASWAGQLETYLNVNRSGLIEAVQKCWASIQSDHAQAYGSHHGFSHDDQAVAVVVQTMVDSKVSGVTFTVNPVTNDKKEIVIESVYGLGEMIVQGTVTPENFVVNKDNNNVTAQSPSRQKKMLVYRNGKNHEVAIPATKLKKPTLTPDQIKELSQVAQKIEKHYGCPQDIEWAIAGDKLYIVQSRPITHGTNRSKLPPQPKAPEGVKYALTVPQSVLFADLSLQGNRRAVFKKVLGIDYEPAYISIDAGGAMSWNYDNDEGFVSALLGIGGSAVDAIDAFIALMERTAKKLDKISINIESSKPRAKKDDLMQDISAYWQAYEEHMTSLFTFWNVEYLLSDTLTAVLKKAGRQNEIDNSLARYLMPDKPNYFVKERIALRKIIDKFKVGSSMTSKNAPKALVDALEAHSEAYGFLLTPFNLDNSLTINELLEHAKEIANEPAPKSKPQDTFADLTPDLKRSVALAQRLTFWKSERLDMFALADARVKRLYREISLALSLEPNDLFAMTCGEIMESLKSGKLTVASDTLKHRQKAYCLILTDGEVGFYEPSVDIGQKAQRKESTELKGAGASVGLATGKAHLIRSLKEAKDLQRGEVIVTAMTRPEMGAALDRAAAFVTDEGGLLCHAAIISREMKKPCVIATGNATKVLHDGDLVEVDGSRGTVRIILGD